MRWVLILGAIAIVLAVVWPRRGSGRVHEGAPAWSPDGRHIAFVVEHDGQSDIFVMNADGSGRRQLTTTPAEEHSPAFSPDGTRIAFESTRDGNAEIYVMDANGRNPTRLTSHPAEDRSPAWSSDGTRIAFLSDRDDAKRFDLYLMRADGSEVTRLTSDATNWSPEFSPDGTRIALQAGSDVAVLALASRAMTRLTFAPANGMSPTWSPDGARIAFATTRHSRPELFTMAASGRDQKPLVTMSGGSTIDPRWSPDGTRVAFVYVEDGAAAGDSGTAYGIYTVEVATGKVSRLSP